MFFIKNGKYKNLTIMKICQHFYIIIYVQFYTINLPNNLSHYVIVHKKYLFENRDKYCGNLYLQSVGIPTMHKLSLNQEFTSSGPYTLKKLGNPTKYANNEHPFSLKYLEVLEKPIHFLTIYFLLS